jgi:hypothetical protein
MVGGLVQDQSIIQHWLRPYDLCTILILAIVMCKLMDQLIVCVFFGGGQVLAIMGTANDETTIVTH